MHKRIITGLALGAISLAALTTAGIAQEARNVPAARGTVERTGSIAAPRAYTAAQGQVVVTDRAAGAYENTLHLFGARTDNAPY